VIIMNKQGLVAVISGDLVRSSCLETERPAVLEGVRNAMESIRSRLAPKNCKLLFSDFYRGDAFQCALSDPRLGLWTAVYLRAELIKLRGKDIRAAARFGLGIGTASEWNEDNISASDGEAFQLSGKALDTLKSSKEKYRRLRILTPWPDQDSPLAVLAACLDAMVQRWTQEQTAAISLFLDDKTQDEISRQLNIRQPAVQTRLQTAGHYAVREMLDYFSRIIDERIIKPNIDNSRI
jgi:hypothetical protein